MATCVSVFPTTCFRTVEEEWLIIRTGAPRPINHREDFDLDAEVHLDAYAGAPIEYLVLVARIGAKRSSNGLKEFVSPPTLVPPHCYWKRGELAAGNDVNIINGIDGSLLLVGALQKAFGREFGG